jgi:Domain found in Dishevelled, Egl-10, and Pleckstrin (DEP)
MSATETSHFVYGDLPQGISQSALNALTNALGLELIPQNKGLFKPLGGVAQKLKQLHLNKPGVSFVLDIGRLQQQGLTIIKLAELIESKDLRASIFLCNSLGHVSLGLRNLIKHLGFAELVADLDPRSPTGGIKILSDWLVLRNPNTKARIDRLPAFLKTVSFSGGEESPRALVQRLTGHPAELMVIDLIKHVETKNRSYRLKNYEACFVGLEACQHLQQKFKLTQAQAVTVGQALVSLGLVYHVAHAQDFTNESFFYRFASSAEADKVAAIEVWANLPKHLDIKDRQYLGKAYPACFVGSEAVTEIAKQWSMQRHEAWIILHRFEQLGLLKHVANEHGFIDGDFFYSLA